MKPLALFLVLVLAAFAVLASFGCDPVVILPPGHNVRDYGAVGNGVTDDSNAIKSAIATLANNDTLYFPAGTYLVKTAVATHGAILTLPSIPIKVMGDGVGVSTIKVGAGCADYQQLMGGGNMSGLEVVGLTFDHNNLKLSGVTSYEEYSIYASSGSNINIHDIEVINSSSVANIGVCGNGSNIIIDNVHGHDLGDDLFAHDSSFIYTEANYVTVSNCDISAVSRNAARTGIETHGGYTEVKNNTITGYIKGMNICDSVAGGSTTNVTVHDNVMNNVYEGIELWSNPTGLDGCEVYNNTVDIALIVGTSDPHWRMGIGSNTTNVRDLTNINIHHNNISVASVETGTTDYYETSAGIYFYGEGTSLIDSHIDNNTITNFGNSGIKFYDHDIDNVTISGNILTNCGCSKKSNSSPICTSPIVFYTPNIATLTVSGNHITDTTKLIYYAVNFQNIGGTCTGVTLSGNTYTLASGGRLIRQIHLYNDLTVPLITETITGFLHPTGKVVNTSRVIDGAYVWTTADGLTWSKTLSN